MIARIIIIKERELHNLAPYNYGGEPGTLAISPLSLIAN